MLCVLNGIAKSSTENVGINHRREVKGCKSEELRY